MSESEAIELLKRQNVELMTKLSRAKLDARVAEEKARQGLQPSEEVLILRKNLEAAKERECLLARKVELANSTIDQLQRLIRQMQRRKAA